MTDYITFAQTYNPTTKFNKNTTNNSLNVFHGNSMKMTFVKKRGKKPLLATRPSKSSQNLLIKARFDIIPKPIAPSENIGHSTC